jgi:hypothetical protein
VSEETSRQKYLEDFGGERQKQALKQALDIRKFEIDLYWKRAIYFWTLIAAAFAGYFALHKDGDMINIYILVCTRMVPRESRKRFVATKLGSSCRSFGR